MSKFKVGDKVVRKPRKDPLSFKREQGDYDYYVITDMAENGYWLQLNNSIIDGDRYPWYAPNFELYQEPDDELPPVPDSVYYQDMYTLLTGLQAVGGTSGLTVRKSPYTSEAISLSIDDSKWTRLDADAALQLAHDLRRMAMDIKRKEKVNA